MRARLLTGDTFLSMGTPLFFTDLKQQASYFLKEKIRSARLALTDVTPAQLMTEEATDGSPWSPDAMTMNQISRAAFEVDDYWRIVDILHKRLSTFERKKWREAYKALILLEHLLTHGPDSASEEFQSDTRVIHEMADFLYIDDKGFNWGVCVKAKAERVVQLLEKGPQLKQERGRARKITRGIQGFGSSNRSTSSRQQEPATSCSKYYGRSVSDNQDYGLQRKQMDNPALQYRCSEKKLLTSDDVARKTHRKAEREDGLKVECLREDYPFCSNLEQDTTSLLTLSNELQSVHVAVE